MRHGFAGSRDYPHLELVEEAVERLELSDIVVSGGARGVDRTAEEAAHRYGIDVVSFRPVQVLGAWRISRQLWDAVTGKMEGVVLPEVYGSFAAAAYVRNGYIVELSETMHIFWDGRSKGTKDTLRKAQAVPLPVELMVDRTRS